MGIYESLYEGMIKAGEQKGWELSPASEALALLTCMPVTLTGKEGDVRVQLSRASSLHTFTTNAFIEPPVPTTFVITSEGVTGAIAHTLGIEDVEIGDKEFDDAFRLVSRDADALKRLITRKVQAALRELAAEASGFGAHFWVTDKLVSLQRPNFGLMTEEETLRDVPLVVSVARTIMEASERSR